MNQVLTVLSDQPALDRLREWAVTLTEEQLFAVADVLTDEQRDNLRDVLAELFPSETPTDPAPAPPPPEAA